ncbi:MAG: tetratricopeptide repeat protein [Dehalococcoidia bacterium]|nr:tetratricopeptide repeat protein [Dehalococcoidia bacterium]
MVVSAFGCFGGLSDYGYGSTAADLAYNKGAELQKQGLHGQAVQDYDKAIQLNPDYALRPGLCPALLQPWCCLQQPGRIHEIASR